MLFLFFRKKVTFEFTKVVLNKEKGGFDVVLKISRVVVILKTTDPLYTTLIKKDLRQMGASCKEQLVFNVYKVSRTKSTSGVVAPGANVLGAELA